MYAVLKKSTVWTTGLAIFAMFFGAGNIVFPLALGQLAQDKNLWAVLGMILTAVLVPLSGVLAMLLFNGDYINFFKRVGKWPGFALCLIIVGLIGPFGGIPRCIAISHSTLDSFGLNNLPFMNLATFTLISCALIFLLTFRPNRILQILGYGLTPLLLLSLGVIAVKGLLSPESATHNLASRWSTFSNGFLSGYNTMDLLASFFFSSGALLCLKKEESHSEGESKKTLHTAMWASLFAGALLALVYIAFSFLAAKQSALLSTVPGHKLLGTLAYLHLGPYAGVIAGLVVAFACLTTEIALALVSAEFLQKRLLNNRVSFQTSLLIILGLSACVSMLQFEGISALLAPILQVFYPGLIVLTLLNIAHKLFDFMSVKLIFYATVTISLACFFIS